MPTTVYLVTSLMSVRGVSMSATPTVSNIVAKIIVAFRKLE